MAQRAQQGMAAAGTLSKRAGFSGAFSRLLTGMALRDVAGAPAEVYSPSPASA